MLILGQKPYFLGPTIFKIPQSIAAVMKEKKSHDDQLASLHIAIKIISVATVSKPKHAVFGIELAYCPDHVISTCRQLKNLLSKFEYLLLLSFLTPAKF